MLLSGDEHIPRYLTASPCMFPIAFTHNTTYLPCIHSLVPSAQPYDDAPKDFVDLLKRRSKYYLPILQWLPHYTFNLFLGDFMSAMTLSCLLIPQGLSYATALCKLEAIHGLMGIAFPAMTYAVFGMSR